MRSSSTCILSTYEQEKLMDKLNIFKIQGQDKRGNKLVRIIGNLFPARLVNVEVLNKYMKEKVFASLSNDEDEVKPFSVVYMHTGVQWRQNFPGLMAARSIYDAIPVNIKKSLQAIYFTHPDLQSRLFLATFGRLLFTQELYAKVNYMSRLQFLWKHVRRNEIDIPDFVYNHDKELDSCGQRRLPSADYSLEIHNPRKQVYSVAAYLESPVSTFSMRRIAY
ncbi:CRAL-TRIO lipid binding domain containing protein [Heracleum sosnowskyi]|uniref:CRAL-TRIO lipid binding domain containing protein n=1 Tax=Heracleum sosnowskyi TaxID=360622 RepID=A0AAD8IMM6_9APIA|nr:CRAL-TRIO lipid binding domain containing protein [Heracleum sosnowskyi]